MLINYLRVFKDLGRFVPEVLTYIHYGTPAAAKTRTNSQQ
jgi:hypothetical protein